MGIFNDRTITMSLQIIQNDTLIIMITISCTQNWLTIKRV